MPKGNKQPTASTVDDVLAAINSFANDTEKRFGEIKERFNSVDKRFNDVGDDLSNITHHQTKQDILLFELKTALFKANARLNTLPTKDYLDEKIGSLRGDITGEQKVTREAIRKVVKTLEHKKIFQADEMKSILRLVEFQPEA